MAKKEDFEYVMLEDVPLMVNDFNIISKDFDASIKNASEHLAVLEDKHDAVAQARAQSSELARMTKRLDSFFIRELALSKEEHVFVPKKDIFATREDKELEQKGKTALRNIQHNLEELKKHLGLL